MSTTLRTTMTELADWRKAFVTHSKNGRPLGIRTADLERLVDDAESAHRMQARPHAEEEQLDILRHSLGLNSAWKGIPYRSHFVTGPGSSDFPICMALVKRGFMTRRAGSPLSGSDDVFHVTEAGLAHARTMTSEGGAA